MKRFFTASVTICGLAAVAALSDSFVSSRPAAAHCQVPCGIYDDHARITAMREDTATIAKAITQIAELSGKHDPLALNQATRWINTKEEHASRIIETVSLYFLTQKVKPVAAGGAGYQAYLESLADHHGVLRAAMTTKQTVSADAATALGVALDRLAKHYPHDH